jgi:uncharacterized protein
MMPNLESTPQSEPVAAGVLPRSAAIIRELGLRVLDGESGYFAEIGVSDREVTEAGRRLRAQSSIYYLLDRARPINFLHWLESDDAHVLVEGGPVDYFLFFPDGRVERREIGSDLTAGQRPVVPVPGGCWKALRLQPTASHALMVNVLSPQWTPDRVRVGAGEEFVSRFADQTPWASRGFLRELIGPNWMG